MICIFNDRRYIPTIPSSLVWCLRDYTSGVFLEWESSEGCPKLSSQPVQTELNSFRTHVPLLPGVRSSPCGVAPPPAVWPLPLWRGPSQYYVTPPHPPKHSASCWCITSTLSALAWRSAGGKTLNQPQVRASFLLRPLVLNMLGAGSLSCGLFRRPPASPVSLCAIPHVGGGGAGQEEAPLGGLSSAHPSFPSSSKFSSLEPSLLILKSIVWKKGKNTPNEY